MSKIDEHKAKFIEKVFLVFLLAFFGMVLLLFVNFEKLIMLKIKALQLSISNELFENFQMLIMFEIVTIGLGLIITCVILFLSLRFLIKKFKQIGDLQ